MGSPMGDGTFEPTRGVEAATRLSGQGSRANRSPVGRDASDPLLSAAEAAALQRSTREVARTGDSNALKRMAIVITLSVVLTACSSTGSQPEPEHAGRASASHAVERSSAGVHALLDGAPAAVATLARFRTRLLESIRRSRIEASKTLDEKLARRTNEIRPSGGVQQSEFRPAVANAPSARVRLPGVHVPVREHNETSQTSTSNEGAVHTTTSSDATIDNQVITISSHSTATVGDEAHPSATSAYDVSSKAELCQPSTRTRVEVTTKVELAGRGWNVTIESHGTYAGGSGPVDIEGVDVSVTTASGGMPASTQTAHVTGSGWDPADGSTVLERATFVPPADSGLTSDAWSAAITFASLQASGAVKNAVEAAREKTESGGLCVLLQASSDKNHLAPGEAAVIQVAVVDARTGEPVADATVTGFGQGGDVAPGSVGAPGTLQFTATGKPDYWAFLEVRTAQGGDDANLRFNAPGWSFEGVAYTATTSSYPAVEVTTTWSGVICGDPLSDAWDVEIVFSSPVASHAVSGTFTAKPFDDAPDGVGARLLIAPGSAGSTGGRPFRLWVDEENPAESPSHHRVEVTDIRPISGACVSS